MIPDGKSALPIIAFTSSADWEAWLSGQPRTSKGVWLKLAKKKSNVSSISRSDAIDSALCHGWIDGMLKPFDASHWLVRFTPRRSKSRWSAINRSKALALIGQSRMSQAGMAEVEAAKADGRWDAAYASQSKATIPDDLQRALEGSRDAQRLFDRLDSRNRYAILYRIQTARTPETRARHVEKYVAMLGRGEAIYPPKTRSG